MNKTKRRSSDEIYSESNDVTPATGSGNRPPTRTLACNTWLVTYSCCCHVDVTPTISSLFCSNKSSSHKQNGSSKPVSDLVHRFSSSSNYEITNTMKYDESFVYLLKPAFIAAICFQSKISIFQSIK